MTYRIVSSFLELLDHLESTECLLLPGNPGDHLSDVVKTITMSHCMSTTSLVLTILNGPSLDVRVLLKKLCMSMTSQRRPLSKDLLSSFLSCVSLSFSSFTTCEERSSIPLFFGHSGFFLEKKQFWPGGRSVVHVWSRTASLSLSVFI